MAKNIIFKDAINGTVELKEQDTPVFHDFLGTKTTSEQKLLAEEAALCPSLASSSGGRQAISATFDLGSGRRVQNQPDGIQGQRSDLSGSNMTNEVKESKRSLYDSLFTGHDSLNSLHRTKIQMLQNGPTNGSPLVNKTSRGGQIGHFVHQPSLSRFKDANAGPSLISPTAADEGCRTSIRDSRILGSDNASVMPDGRKAKSSTLSRCGDGRQDVNSGSRQMTIFYGGQAHVFDEVHPKKADVILALAGSSSESWSTIFSPKQKLKRPGNEQYSPGEES